MKLLRQEQGYAMLLVILTTVLISVISLGLLTMNVNSVKTSKNEEVDQAVFYIAEAGLNYELLEIETEVNEAYKKFLEDFDEADKEDKKRIIDDFPENLYSDIETAVLNLSPSIYKYKTETSEASVVIIKDHSVFSQNSRKYEVVSIGKINDKERIVSQIITIEIPAIDPDIDNGNSGNIGGKYAVHTSGNITVSGSAIINGPIATQNGVITINSPNSLSSTDKIGANHVSMPDWFTIPNELIGPQPLPIEFQTLSPNDLPSFLANKYINFQKSLTESIKIQYPSSRTEPPIHGGKDLILIDNNGNLNTTTSGSYAKNYTIEMNGDMRFNNFTVGEGYTITLNVGDYAKNLYIENLSNSGVINIVGSGKLNIYTKKYDAHNGNLYSGNVGGLEINTNTYIMRGGWPGPTVGVLESGKIDIYVNDSFSATGDSTFNTNEKGDVSIYYLGTNKPELGDSPKQINSNIYAPRAIVQIIGSRLVKGKIISKDFIASGNSKITFGETPPNNGSEIPTDSIFKKPNFKFNFIVEN